MVVAEKLPLPHMEVRPVAGIELLTDDALASSVVIRAAFTGVAGGQSKAPFAGLNLGSHVGDDPVDVEGNRRLLLQAAGAPHAQLVVPNQVHGTEVVTVSSVDPKAVSQARSNAEQGADALVVSVPNVAALLCFADCVPVILAAPDGSFSVVHAGWRGAVAGIAGKAVSALSWASGLPAETFNAYIGPHIHRECFQTGEDVAERFRQAFGPQCVPDSGQVDLAQAVTVDLRRAGMTPRRIFDVGICTRCNPERYYSYRASAGVCGRHGALAVRLEERP